MPLRPSDLLSTLSTNNRNLDPPPSKFPLHILGKAFTETEEMRLPAKLWRDVHNAANTLPDEFNIASPTFQYSRHYSAD